MGTTMLTLILVLGAPHKPHHQTYFEQKSAQVMRSFLVFSEARTVEEEQNRLQHLRDRDALMLGGRAPSMQAGGLGSMVMGAAIVLAAHAPDKLRPLVDGPVHVGPALFDGGGMGAGVGGRF